MTQGGFGPPGDPYGGAAPFAGHPFAPRPGEPPPASTGPAGAPPPPRPNTLATLSIVFAFVFAPAGAVLGHLGLTQTRRTGQPGRERAVIGLTLSYLFITVAVVALVVWTVTGDSATTPTVAAPPATTPATSAAAPTPTTTTPPAPPKVDAAGMAGLLLSLDEIKVLMGDPNMVSDITYNDVELPTPDQGVLEPADCLGSFAGGVPQPYEGTNYRKYLATTQIGRQTGQQVGESVAIFDDAAAAQKALANYIEGWRRCAGTRGTWTSPGQGTQTVILGAPVDAGGGITTLRNTIEGVPADFYRTLAAKDNVLIDNQVGGIGLTDQPITLTKRILERIPG